MLCYHGWPPIRCIESVGFAVAKTTNPKIKSMHMHGMRYRAAVNHPPRRRLPDAHGQRLGVGPAIFR